MKKKKGKKKFTLKRLKKILMMVRKNIVEYFKKLYENFMNLPKKIRLVTYVWASVLLIVIFIIVFATSNNKYLEKYVAIENDMNNATLNFVKDYELYPSTENKLKLDLNVLIDYNYISDIDVNDNKCEGFTVVSYDDLEDDYKIDSFINCKKYTTKYYSDYK